MTKQPNDPLAWLDEALAELDRRDLRRRLTTYTGRQGPVFTADGVSLVNFGSNDYLSLAGDPRLAEAAAAASRGEGWGAGASPLVVGHADSHRRLELALADFEGVEAALLFSSGFAANLGAVSALVERGDAIFADELNHASLIDGCRLSRADVHVYPHADVGRLEHLLEQNALLKQDAPWQQNGRRRRLIVTDSLFSMQGDLAPLVELAGLAERFGAMLFVDEAHATGVFGRLGRGVAEHLGVEHRVHVRVGTLSKGLGCHGGFVAGRRALIDWLVNRARPYVFSTAPPPANSAAAVAALAIARAEPERGRDLLQRAAALRGEIQDQGWSVGRSQSQIIPIVVGEAAAALQLSAALRRRGLLVPAIRPPSVPDGQACLRISLTWGHTPEMIGKLTAALAKERGLRS